MTHLERLRAAMASDGRFDALLITSQINQRYLTGFDYTDGFVLVTEKRACLLADFRYIEAAKASRAASEFEIIMPNCPMLEMARRIFSECGVKRIGVEEATLALRAFESCKSVFEGCEVLGGASALIDTLREYKDAEEMASIAKAQSIADAAFSHIVEFIRPDMTEMQVALELEFFMRSHGAEAAAFETIAISGSASSRPHGVPCYEKLEKGFLTMDYGAKVDGYCSDMTRTIIIGKADAEQREIYNTVLRAQLAALELAKEGIGCYEMDFAARHIIDSAGYGKYFGHALGHGVGMYVHESPNLSPRSPRDKVLKVGHIVTVEPGIYIEGKYGCRIEDMIGVTEQGIVNFAHSTKELIEIY